MVPRQMLLKMKQELFDSTRCFLNDILPYYLTQVDCYHNSLHQHHLYGYSHGFPIPGVDIPREQNHAYNRNVNKPNFSMPSNGIFKTRYNEKNGCASYFYMTITTAVIQLSSHKLPHSLWDFLYSLRAGTVSTSWDQFQTCSIFKKDRDTTQRQHRLEGRTHKQMR